MRKIGLLTGSRGEWGYIRPILREIEESQDMGYQLIVTHMQLLPEFGMAVNEIEREGFTVHEKLYMTLDGYNNITMTKSLGLLLVELTSTLARLKPDILLLAGDRGEQLMGAIAGGHMGIPVAHIQAGELSGNIDGIVRHSITKLAHIHFAANEEFAERVRKMGEQDFRVFNTGAPQLDELVKGDYTPLAELNAKFNLQPEEEILLAVQHPVTEEEEAAGAHIQETIAALKNIGLKTMMIYPNADAGSAEVRKELQKLKGTNIQLYRNLPRRDYLGLMRSARAIVGNSSSGILEAPSFGLACVNIGRRQNGRPQADNVINVVEYNRQGIEDAIKTALNPGFQQVARAAVNPYGDGQSTKRIVNILRTIPIDSRLLNKEMAY
ncbi:MAG: UDP-N-acetylglucosamine 2-epimerase (hydrolyzing) [Sphingobacteriales bacterium]|nr:MAG: UDP-N-acetylglucosamine 2-epimerase (hydrolyzing) [Sphingobacteriales bacterium]